MRESTILTPIPDRVQVGGWSEASTCVQRDPLERSLTAPCPRLSLSRICSVSGEGGHRRLVTAEGEWGSPRASSTGAMRPWGHLLTRWEDAALNGNHKLRSRLTTTAV